MIIVYIAYGVLTPTRAHNLQTVATVNALAGQGTEVTFINPKLAAAGAPLNLPRCSHVLLPAGRCFSRHKSLTSKGRFWSLFLDRSVYALRCLRHVRSARADVVVTRDVVVCFWMLAARLFVRVPVVYELHTLEQVMFGAEEGGGGKIARGVRSATASDFAGHQNDESSPGRLFKRFIRRVENYTLRTARMVIVLTAAMGRRLKREYGAGNTRVVPSGHGFPRPARIDRPGARNALGLPADRRIAIYSGLSFHGKGLELVFAVARHLPSDCMILVLGDTPQTSARLAALSREIGLDGKLRFVPSVPHEQVPAWLASADAGLLLYPNSPYLAEFSSPLKAFEYLACGLPLIATRLPALEEVVKDGINGILVDSEDPPAAAAAIAAVLRDSALLEQLGSAARECSSQYHYSRRAERILDAIADSPAGCAGTGEAPCIST
jgi:glycosyltransferase involved in cell wall biosynthesis